MNPTRDLIIATTFTFLLLFHNFAYACTTILVGKNLTIDGTVIHAHNEDMGFATSGRIWFTEANIKPHSIDIPYLTLKSYQRKYAYWASGNTLGDVKTEETDSVANLDQYQDYNSVLVGMNEKGVSLSCNWMHAKSNVVKEKGIRRYALRQIVLEQAASAREAVELIGRFVEEYGQADWSGLTFNLTDKNEAWVVETTQKHWVAKKLGDDEIIAIANRFIISDDYDLSSEGLIEFAEQKGWYHPKKEKFSFRKAFGKTDLLEQDYDIKREQRVYQLLKSSKGKISYQNLFNVLQDRYQGTADYTPPLDFENWREASEQKKVPRTINSNLTQSTFVTQHRTNMPDELQNIFWIGLANTRYSGYFPIYSSSTAIDASYSYPQQSCTNKSAWWSYRNLQRKVDQQSVQSVSDRVMKSQQTYQAKVAQAVQEFEKKLLSNHSDSSDKQTELNQFVLTQSGNQLARVNQLFSQVNMKDSCE